MKIFKTGKNEIHFKTLGDEKNTPIIWAHGWGQSHKSLELLAQSIEKEGYHIMVDFPGFGKSPSPAEPWGSEDYAAAIAAFLESKNLKNIIWVGHSFGCRVGIRLAAANSSLISGLFLISAAGLPRQRSWIKKLYLKTRILIFKFLKKLIPLGISKKWLMSIFSSPDYKNAGSMRETLVKVVNEDLSDIASQITCPVMLAYGENDNETPPEMGERYNKIILSSEMVHLSNQDHYSVLADGRHQVTHLLKKFITNLNTKHD